MVGLFLLSAILHLQSASAIPSDWSHWVRLCGNGLSRGNSERLVRSANRSGVYGIEVDNDVTGRYDSFLDPTAKIFELKEAVAAAHRAHQPVFSYVAGTECITANADKTAHSVLKEHSDWVQQDKSGRKAVFKAGDAFWISKGDEDAWISPFAPAWRKQYMRRIRQVASTGLDGIYVDIPYWMTHFDGWENTWASFDKYTLAAFYNETGLNALTQVELGNYRDAGFRKWIRFRIRAITEFVAEIDRNVKSINPRCLTIPEIYPGFDQSATIVGADVYELSPVSDVICHEFNPGERSSIRTQKDWLTYMIGLESFRGFAQGKPTWMLSYSWSGEKLPSPQNAMENLAIANIVEGANMWDAARMVMSGSNNLAERKRIYTWIKKNEKNIYSPRTPINPVGIYFSPASRDYDPSHFVDEFAAQVARLMASHTEIQIITPRTLAKFHGKDLIFPYVSCVSSDEIQKLVSLGRTGVSIRADGRFGIYDELGTSAPFQMLNTLLKKASSKSSVGNLSEEYGLNVGPDGVRIDAPREVFTQIAQCQDCPTVWIANFTGLGPKKSGQPTTVRGIKITFPEGSRGRVVYTPFLRESITIRSEKVNGRVSCTLPPVQNGAIVQLRP